MERVGFTSRISSAEFAWNSWFARRIPSPGWLSVIALTRWGLLAGGTLLLALSSFVFLPGLFCLWAYHLTPTPGSIERRKKSLTSQTEPDLHGQSRGDVLLDSQGLEFRGDTGCDSFVSHAMLGGLRRQLTLHFVDCPAATLLKFPDSRTRRAFAALLGLPHVRMPHYYPGDSLRTRWNLSDERLREESSQLYAIALPRDGRLSESKREGLLRRILLAIAVGFGTLAVLQIGDQTTIAGSTVDQSYLRSGLILVATSTILDLLVRIAVTLVNKREPRAVRLLIGEDGLAVVAETYWFKHSWRCHSEPVLRPEFIVLENSHGPFIIERWKVGQDWNEFAEFCISRHRLAHQPRDATPAVG